MADNPASGSRRETRLLLATIAVSVGMLLLLARFRFPEEAARQTVEPSPAPLERLAARATFDELAGIMADLERRILPAVSTVVGQSDGGSLFVPAVRMTPDRAIAILPGEFRVSAADATVQPRVLLRDAVRNLVVIQPPPRPDAAPAVPATGDRLGPRYVAVVETPGGTPAIRPVYVGRTDPFGDPKWSDPLIRVAAVQQSISTGAAVFSLDGAFIGLAVPEGGRVIVIPAATLRNVAVSANAAPSKRAALPFEVQPLTADLAKAAGASQGVMIAYVSEPGLPVAAGDVVQSIDGTKVTSIPGYEAAVQSRTPGEPVTLGIVRRGQPLSVSVTAVEPDLQQAGSDFGAVLRPVSGVGSEVVIVEPGGAADRAGIRRGDLIIAADGDSALEPAALLRRYRNAVQGDVLLLTLHRDGGHRIVAVEKR